MMPPIYRFVSLPRTWPGRARPAGFEAKRSPFKFHSWTKIEDELLSQLKLLKAKDITIALDVTSPGHFREDGGLRADAKTVTPRVIVSFTKGDQGLRLTFPCDAYGAWQDNVWAIRLTLEYLRAIDRYGVTQGDQQYVGFAALPAGQKAGLTLDQGIALLQLHGDAETIDLVAAPEWLVDTVLKRARAATHPDAGGATETFQQIEEAMRLVLAERANT